MPRSQSESEELGVHMNSPNGKIAEIPLPEAEQKALAASQGGFKIFNRIVDWITNDRMQLINVTDRINEIVRKSGIRDGIVHLQSLHTTTSVFINEWQDALLHDVRTFFDDVVRREEYYRHNDPKYSDCERKCESAFLRSQSE